MDDLELEINNLEKELTHKEAHIRNIREELCEELKNRNELIIEIDNLKEKQARKSKKVWTFTEEEKAYLRTISKDYNFITKDKDSFYCELSKTEPKRRPVEGIYATDPNTRIHISEDALELSCIKWEDYMPCPFRKFI